MSKSAPYFIGAIAWFGLAMWPIAFLMHVAMQNTMAWWGFPAFMLPLIIYVGITILLFTRGIYVAEGK